jgi:hypothetical protein
MKSYAPTRIAPMAASMLPGRDHDHRMPGRFPGSLTQLQAIHLCHAQVADHGVKILGYDQLQRLGREVVLSV